MVKPKYITLSLVIALALVAYWYYHWGSSPPGQPPLTSLTPMNLDQFKQAFNGAADRARLVLLLSPT
jgi:hypothetical protein